MGKKVKLVLGVLWGLIVVAFVPGTVQGTCYDDDGKIVSCKTPVYRYYDQDGNYSIHSERPDKYTLYINTVYFPNTMLSYYWSSTNHSYFTYYAWAMYFHFGKDDYRYKETALYVRAVRYGR